MILFSWSSRLIICEGFKSSGRFFFCFSVFSFTARVVFFFTFCFLYYMKALSLQNLFFFLFFYQISLRTTTSIIKSLFAISFLYFRGLNFFYDVICFVSTHLEEFSLIINKIYSPFVMVIFLNLIYKENHIFIFILMLGCYL